MAKSELMTLSEVSKRTNISMPTLQRYKKEHQDRIPSEGQGRKQRYPESALEVFKAIKKENIQKRGRPKKQTGAKAKTKSAKPGRKGKRAKAAPAAAPASGGLLTLTEISERTGISYPTLSRYVKQHLASIPHEGKGRRRRYHPEAVEVFQNLYQNRGRSTGAKAGKAKAAPAAKAGRRGRKSAAAAGTDDGKLVKRLEALERSQDGLEKQIKELIQLVRKPLTVTIRRTK